MKNTSIGKLATALLISTFFSFITDSRAAESRSSSRSSNPNGHLLYVGAGAFLHNMFKITSSNDASSSTTGQIYAPIFSLGIRFRPLGLITLQPTAGYTPFALKEADQVSKKVLTLAIPVVFTVNNLVDLKAGPGILFYSVRGDGGQAVLNNGTGTATFYRPAGSQTAREIFADLGASVKLPVNLQIDGDLMLTNLLSKRRGINFMISITEGLF